MPCSCAVKHISIGLKIKGIHREHTINPNRIRLFRPIHRSVVFRTLSRGRYGHALGTRAVGDNSADGVGLFDRSSRRGLALDRFAEKRCPEEKAQEKINSTPKDLL